jgi:hypothetical protein
VIDAPGSSRTVCRGINDSGVICGHAKFGAARYAFVDDHGTFTTFAFPGAPWTEARGISGPDPILAEASFDVVGLYTLAGLNQSHGFVTTLSPPHLVKWDGDEWVHQKLGADTLIQQGGRIEPAPGWTRSPIVRPPQQSMSNLP